MAKNNLARLTESDFNVIAIRFKALSEPSRLKIIAALQAGEKSVNDLAETTGLSQSNVSRHLTLLVASALLGRRKERNNVFYRIVDKSLTDLCSLICRSISNR